MSDTTRITGWLRAMAAMDEADEPAITSPHRVAADYIDEQQKRIDALAAHVERLKAALPDKVVDLVRCGIGGNYGGEYYNEALDKYYHPLVDILKQSPQTSLADVRAREIENLIQYLGEQVAVNYEGNPTIEQIEDYANKIRNVKEQQQ